MALEIHSTGMTLEELRAAALAALDRDFNAIFAQAPQELFEEVRRSLAAFAERDSRWERVAARYSPLTGVRRGEFERARARWRAALPERRIGLEELRKTWAEIKREEEKYLRDLEFATHIGAGFFKMHFGQSNP